MKTLQMPIALLALSVSATIVAAPAETVSQQLQACRAIASDTDRLACFDALTAGLPATASGGVEASVEAPDDARVPVAAQPPAAPAPPVATQAAPATPQAPVASAPSAPAQASSPSPETSADPTATFGAPKVVETQEPQELIAEVARIERTPYGKLILYLENGQVWQQLDSRRSTIRAGDTIRIRVTLSGAYQLNKREGGSSIQVRRTDV